jgi:ABC-type antimicrobial peptide transport system permease subunit
LSHAQGHRSYIRSDDVTQRTAEIDVPMAPGASRSAVVGMIVFYGLRRRAGVVIGICTAVALTRAMATSLYGR